MNHEAPRPGWSLEHTEETFAVVVQDERGPREHARWIAYHVNFRLVDSAQREDHHIWPSPTTSAREADRDMEIRRPHDVEFPRRRGGRFGAASKQGHCEDGEES